MCHLDEFQFAKCLLTITVT